MSALTLPPSFGYVVLAWPFLGVISNLYIGSVFVMKARKKYNVKYPTMYLGRNEKHAQEFNSIQRGHQNMLEMQAVITICALVGALAGENCAKANAVSGVLFNLGSYFYAKGYSTAEENGSGRYKSGGGIKWLGIMIAFGTCGYFGLTSSNLI